MKVSGCLLKAFLEQHLKAVKLYHYGKKLLIESEKQKLGKERLLKICKESELLSDNDLLM